MIVKISFIVLFVVNCHSQNFCSGNTFFNTITLKCQPCSQSCQGCVLTSTTCTSCASTFFNSTIGCTPCIQNCLICSSNTTCTACMPEYFLSNNICASCPQNCAVCTTSSSCGVCNIGYDINTGCKTCFAGFIMNPYISLCIPCALGCKSCATLTTCAQCYTELGFQLEVSGKCTLSLNIPPTGASNNVYVIAGTISGFVALIIMIVLTKKYCLKSNSIEPSQIDRQQALQNQSRVSDNQFDWKVNKQNQNWTNKLPCAYCKKTNTQLKALCQHCYHITCLQKLFIKRDICSCPKCPGKISKKLKIYCQKCHLKHAFLIIAKFQKINSQNRIICNECLTDQSQLDLTANIGSISKVNLNEQEQIQHVDN